MPIRDLADLGEAVRDVDDQHARGGEAPGEAEQPVGLARRQRRRRLVEDQDRGVAGERLGDLDDLALGERQPAHLDVGPDDGNAVALEQRQRRLRASAAALHGAERR